jgi:NAD(P)-dependent dehydrogenase (short-subunit alcohol dehydrogenase family)
MATDVGMAGKLVLVTGASRGIGAATALRFVEAGARVVRIARSESPAALGAIDIRADLADPAARTAALQQMHNEHGVPDIIVSNAGTFLLAPIDETSDALLREQLAINVEAPYAVARHFLPEMRRRGSGRHILVGSVADWRAFPENSAYSASKFGARGLHEVLVQEFQGSGVLCTLVSPGPTDTSVWDPFDPDNREGFPPRSAMLQPDGVADAILWAASRPANLHVELIRLSPGG